MADLKFTADYSDLSKTVDVLVKIGKASDDTAKAFSQAARQIVSWQQKFAAEQGRVNAQLETNYQKQTLANKSAKDSANIFKQQAMEIERLSTAYKPLYAASKLYENELNNLDKAHKLNVISSKQHEAALEQLNREYAAGVGRFSTYANAMGKGANRMGVAFQQTGYQVGDFLVQVQSGTNPMVAFGQQATQLVGIMYLLPEATLAAKVSILGLKVSLASIALGLGIAIPLITAIGAAWMKSRESNKYAEGSLRSYSEAADEARKNIAELRQEEEARAAGFSDTLSYELQKGVDIAEAALRVAKARLDTDLEETGVLEAQVTKAEEELQIRKDLLSEYEKEIVARERLAEIQSDYKDMLEEILADQDDAAKSHLQRVADLQTENDLLRIRREYGEDSKAEADYLIAQKQEELDALRQAGLLTQAQVDAEMALVREQAQLNVQLQEAEARGNALADALERASSAMASLTSFGSGIDKQLQVAVAQVEALRAGQDAAVAGQIAGLRVDLEAKTQEALRADPANALMINAEAAITRSQINELEKQRALAAELRDQQRGSGGSSDKTPYIQQLMAEAQYKSEIVSLSDEEARRREVLFELAKREETATDAEIQQILDLEAATTKATEALKQAERQQEFYKDTLMDGMESIVDGSKSVNEAFRDMLRNMLLDIYRQKVLAPAAEGIMSLFMAKGGAFNKGVQMFADGGVVSSPTMFGHSGGLGMMGEAGPEAIMPLKRGPDGKLGVAGGNAPVNVTNVFNFSANGDDSVKRIIAQAAPQIAQMTQKQIMDSRRRGGQMKATFS